MPPRHVLPRHVLPGHWRRRARRLTVLTAVVVALVLAARRLSDSTSGSADLWPPVPLKPGQG